MAIYDYWTEYEETRIAPYAGVMLGDLENAYQNATNHAFYSGTSATSTGYWATFMGVKFSEAQVNTAIVFQVMKAGNKTSVEFATRDSEGHWNYKQLTAF